MKLFTPGTFISIIEPKRNARNEKSNWKDFNQLINCFVVEVSAETTSTIAQFPLNHVAKIKPLSPIVILLFPQLIKHAFFVGSFKYFLEFREVSERKELWRTIPPCARSLPFLFIALRRWSYEQRERASRHIKKTNSIRQHRIRTKLIFITAFIQIEPAKESEKCVSSQSTKWKRFCWRPSSLSWWVRIEKHFDFSSCCWFIYATCWVQEAEKGCSRFRLIFFLSGSFLRAQINS